jgi:hypothetical protein
MQWLNQNDCNYDIVFHYKLFVIVTYEDLCSSSWTKANLNKLIDKIRGLGVAKGSK